MSAERAEGLLIRGGTIVDGTGAAAHRGDLRIRGDRIAEIAPSLAPRAGERAVDASGCFVAPGFIESHTHYDGPMWWAPDMDPLPGYGVTTSIMGNCGFSAAPISDDRAARDEMVDIFAFFEDIPKQPLQQLPWDWRRWSDYRRSLERRVAPATNYGAFVGHIALRFAVMGAAAWERAATSREVAQMVELLEDALVAGALGLSTNALDHDDRGRSVPSFHADEEEWAALFDTLERHPAATLQIALDIFIHQTAAEWVARFARMIGRRPLRVQFGGLIPTLEFQAPLGPPLRALFEEFKRSGRDYWAGYVHTPTTTVVNIDRTLIFAQSDEFVWQEVVSAASDDAKSALLRDPGWRARARDSWDHEAHEFSPFGDPSKLLLLASANGAGPVGLGLVEYAAQLGVHASDAMAEWFLRNGLRSIVHMKPFPMAEATVLELIQDPMTVGNLNDAPAHGKMMCGAGENVLLLTDWVRDRKAISLEQAVHVLTGKAARHFNLRDVGELAVGKRADVTVFALDEIECRPMQKAFDVPDGRGGVEWRWTRPPAPVRLTLVNGVPTFEAGKPTEARPGRLLTPA